MKIVEIEKKSIGSKVGLLVGDELQMINHHPVRDLIDYTYYVSDESLFLQIRRDGKSLEVQVEKDADEDIGLHLEPTQFKSCGNNCIFCFIDQLPAGMRPSLYFKDEDYRLSFLHGSYITLTEISKDDLDRIIEQRLSPLYVSVHATDPQLRRNMMRGKDTEDLLDKIEYLSQGNIELHTQVVICPGINDGPQLERTVKDLSRFYPHVRTVAIVPVGLTKHRQGLYPLKRIDPPYARAMIDNFQPWQENYRRTLGETFLHFADEFYLLSGSDIPPPREYDDFPQVENGVGIIRQCLDTFFDRKSELPTQFDAPTSVTLVTGTLANTFLNGRIIPTLSRVRNLKIQTAPVINHFFGESVTVSGLLTGEDIARTLQESDRTDVVMLPPNCLNNDGLLLDSMSIEKLERRVGRRIIVGTYDLIGSLLDLTASF